MYRFVMLQGNERELHFSMVDGDFKKFEGKWSVKSGPRYVNVSNMGSSISFHSVFFCTEDDLLVCIEGHL